MTEIRRRQSNGIVPRLNGSCDLLLDGRWVASGSAEAMAAAARLFGLDGQVGCVTPNGMTDGHGVYVEFREGRSFCAFCHQPLDGKPP